MRMDRGLVELRDEYKLEGFNEKAMSDMKLVHILSTHFQSDRLAPDKSCLLAFVRIEVVDPRNNGTLAFQSLKIAHPKLDS